MLVGETLMVAVGEAAVTVKVAEELPLPPAPVQVRTYPNEPVAVGVTLIVPLVPSLPLHAPDAVQAVVLAVDQVKVALCPKVMLAGDTPMVTVGAGGAVTVTLVAVEADAAFAASPP